MTPLLDLFDRSHAVSFGLAVTAKAAIPLLAATLMSLGLRRRSAAARHLVWTSGLLGALAVPAFSGLLPRWPVEVTVPIVRSLAADSSGAAVVQASAEKVPQNSRFEIGDLKAPRFENQGVAPASVPAESVRAPVDWAALLPMAWILGATAALLPMLAGAAGLALVARRAASVADPVLSELVRALSAGVGLHCRVRLLQSSHAAMPMTWGWLRPTVLLPAGFGEWTEDRQRVVLLHELAHIKRLDCLTQQFAQWVVALYWFNPLAWLAAHRMRVERERACDDLVLLAGSRPSDYARHLLTIARTLHPPGLAGAAAVAMARRSQLESRIRSILDARSRPCALRRGVAFLGLLGALGPVLPLSMIRLHAANEANETASSASAGRSEQVTVAGVVVGPDGKPLTGAKVAVLALRKRSTADRVTPRSPDLLGTAESDREGRFSVSIARTSTERYWQPVGIAAAPGFGLGGVSFGNNSASPRLGISLPAERVVRGRLVDLQGQPAAGVEVRVESVSTYSASNFNTGYSAEPTQLGAPWPERATTDSQGRFSIRGLALNQNIRLAVHDDRYAHQTFDLERNDPQAGLEKTLSLTPAQVLDIRIVGEDGGRGIPHARVLVSSARGTGPMRRSMGYVDFEADANGRVTVHPKPGDHFVVAAYPPAGEPYLLRTKEVAWPKAALKQDVELALRTGVVVRGQITESAKAKPVAGARVFYLQPYENNPFYRSDGQSPWFGWGPDTVSGADGRFSLAVSSGKGHLLIQGPSPEFIHVETSTREIKPGDVGNERAYPDGLVKLDLKPEEKMHDVSVPLRRGVTVSGRVIDPDGRPVPEAVLFCRTYVPFSYLSSECSYSGETVAVRDGQFELPGLDPEKSVPVFFFDVKNAIGTTVELSGKSAANGPVTVQLQKCGSARLRLVDKQGKLVSAAKPSAEVVVTPGTHFPGDSNNPRADSAYQANFDRERHNSLVADDQGRFTLPALIPGASYLLWGSYEGGRIDPVDRTFTAEAGKMLDLSDVTVKIPERK